MAIEQRYITKLQLLRVEMNFEAGFERRSEHSFYPHIGFMMHSKPLTVEMNDLNGLNVER